MGTTKFRIWGIDWESGSAALPLQVFLKLPDWLVLAEDDVEDEEWDEVINEMLQARFGDQSTCMSYEPAEMPDCPRCPFSSGWKLEGSASLIEVDAVEMLDRLTCEACGHTDSLLKIYEETEA